MEQDQAIARLEAEGFGAEAIYRHLNAEGLFDPPNDPVSVSTIRRRLRDLRSSDQSAPWSALDASPEEALLVLDVAAHVFNRTEGRVWLTNDRAKLVARVRALAPTLPLDWAYGFARAYQIAKAQKRDTRVLDLTLAMGPWKDSESTSAWAITIREKLGSDTRWPGEAAGFMMFMAQLPPPAWAGESPIWGTHFWKRLVGPARDEAGAHSVPSPIDSNLTAEVANGPTLPETSTD